MITHTIIVDGYGLSPNVLEVGTQGSYGNDQIELTLSDDWRGLTVRVSFYPVLAEPVTIFYSGDAVLVPSEVFGHWGNAKMVISGETEGRVMISYSAILRVPETLKPAHAPPPSFASAAPAMSTAPPQPTLPWARPSASASRKREL